MNLKTRDTCPLCGSASKVLLTPGTIEPDRLKGEDFKITDSHYGTRWTFYSCRQCRFVFSNPYITEEQVMEFYNLLEDPEYGSEEKGRAKNFASILKRLKKLEKPGNRLLDIGAANGIFLNLARAAGYTIQGIEPSDFLVAEAQRLYGIKLWPGTIENFPGTQRFSVITLLDLIEHLVNPDRFMTRIDDLLEKDGLLVIVTPDIDSLAAKLAKKRWWHFRAAHLNFYNLASLTYLLGKHGYRIIKKKRYAWHFSLFYLVTRVFPGLKNKKTLQKALKSIHFKLQLFDSWEIYARKK